MKKLFSVVALLLLGFGCIPVANAPVNGRWQLAFDLPSGWDMVLPYDDSEKPINENVVRSTSEVWLQSSKEKLPTILPEGQTLISVTKVDSHRVLPKTLQDLGKGFFKDTGYCETVDPLPGKTCNDPYYLKTDSGNFYFQVDGDMSVAEPIIKSAKIVTHYTDDIVTIQPTASNVIKIEPTK